MRENNRVEAALLALAWRHLSWQKEMPRGRRYIKFTAEKLRRASYGTINFDVVKTVARAVSAARTNSITSMTKVGA